MRLAGKVAVVTGASRGIGKAIAKGFVREGARLVLAARSEVERTAGSKESSTSGREGLRS